MRFGEICRTTRLFTQSWVLLFALVLAGCLSEDLTEPEPVPLEPDPVPVPALPSLVCAPFIQTGYTDKISYSPGENVEVFFDSKESASLCTMTIYSINGDSVLSLGSSVPLVPQLPSDASLNGYDFPVAVSFELPEMESGVYMIERKIPFIVKTDEAVDVMVVYASNTANAYALSGGKSLYSAQARPEAVSFHRPIPLEPFSGACLKWFTTLDDMRVGYVADIDMDHYDNIARAKVLVIPGHSEYWTREARLNFDRFVDGGGHALILSGNTMWWQVRYSPDASQMICYKNIDLDPVTDPLFKTIEWDAPTLEYSILSSIGAHFPLGGYGMKADNGWNGYKIVAPSSPLFDGLGLKEGDIISLPSVEYDGAPVSGYDGRGYPILDTDALGFEKIELLGFDRGFRGTETTATFIVFKKSAQSGIVMNTASTDWCSGSGMGGRSGNTIKTITYNALTKLLNNQPVFSE